MSVGAAILGGMATCGSRRRPLECFATWDLASVIVRRLRDRARYPNVFHLSYVEGSIKDGSGSFHGYNGDKVAQLGLQAILSDPAQKRQEDRLITANPSLLSTMLIHLFKEHVEDDGDQTAPWITFLGDIATALHGHLVTCGHNFLFYGLGEMFSNQYKQNHHQIGAIDVWQIPGLVGLLKSKQNTLEFAKGFLCRATRSSGNLAPVQGGISMRGRWTTAKSAKLLEQEVWAACGPPV